MVAAPAVVGAVAVDARRSAELGRGETRHRIGDAHFRCRRMERRERAIEFGELRGVVDELVVVRIETAEADEEDLALHLQRAAHVDQSRDHAKLAAEVRVREYRRERGFAVERLVDHDLVVHRATHDRRVLPLQRVAVRCVAQCQERVAPPRRPVVDEPDALGAILADEIRHHLVSGLEHVLAVDRDVHRELRVRIGLVEHVREPAAPAAARVRVGVRALPGHGLVAVREQLRRHRHRARLVLGLGDRVEQRPDVRGDRERRTRALVEQRAQLRHRGREAVLRAVARRDRRIQRQQLRGRDREFAACGVVGRARGAADRREHVERVVAAVEVHADERAVVVAEQDPAGFRRGVRDRKLAREAREHRGARGGAQGALDEVASFHGVTVRSRIRGNSGSATPRPARVRAGRRRRRPDGCRCNRRACRTCASTSCGS